MKPNRGLVRVGSGVVLMGLVVGAFWGSAPSTDGICDRLLVIAERGGGPEAVQDVTHAQCVVSYRERRDERGRLGFAWLGWCIRLAPTLDRAARC